MFKKFYPHEYVESVFSIDYTKLHAMGFRAVIFDLDNTLTHHGEGSTKEVDELFVRVHEAGLKTLILSDNCSERIDKFLVNINCAYIPEAGKPNTKNYYKALEMLDVKSHEAVMVGDQIFGDIYGANKSGIASILVKYMRHSNKEKIGIRRNLEKIILAFYSLSSRHQNRLGNINAKGSL